MIPEEFLQLGAGFAGMLIILKMMLDSQKDRDAQLMTGFAVMMKGVCDDIEELKADIKELNKTIIDMQIHKGS